jgi:predicted CoA-substrate-specific enzyme activase
MQQRFLGLDVGAETIKVVELSGWHGALECTRKALVEHHKTPCAALLRLLEDWDWEGLSGAAACGRLSRELDLQRVPIKQAQVAALRRLRGDRATTVISIGSHGFSVLELRNSGAEVFRENSRCSQGTGNFLRQLVERFDLSIDQASALVEDETEAAPLSGRCPVILKTDMTHLANKGESRSRILAGLFDAVCENVQVLIKPRLSPPEVILVGGVTRSRRVRENFRAFLERHGMHLIESQEDQALFFEALGSALVAAERPQSLPALADLLLPQQGNDLERVPALSDYLDGVKRMTRETRRAPAAAVSDRLILGFDIGSTGSKIVALECETCELVWEGYVSTNGQPVAAAQTLMARFLASEAGARPVVAFGATGSGREVVGSLLATCYDAESVYILNEIVAHAEGALHYDPRVDTIFEIGGQDAKYARLANGRVVDAAMNEACSAGTGSFIEEQGRKFSSIENVVQLGQEALRADCGVSLGQHCSVFMAEVIDEAVAAGVAPESIIAGIYDSITQNYLNRVKGCRSVGDVIFCQGMPFAADALAAAVARQTGSQVIVPPSPGTVGALGIALLARKTVDWESRTPRDGQRFLDAEVTRKDTFVCKSTKGCGGSGNRCRIDRITTVVEARKQNFTWGGGCSLWDRGTGHAKLPDKAPDPFQAREQMLKELIERVSLPGGGPRVAVSDEFMLKGLFPFFATFLHEMDFELAIGGKAGQQTLKRGIEEANVPFCAPMQLYHGLIGSMAEAAPDYIFVPMLREVPRVANEAHSAVCPIAQSAPDLLRWILGDQDGGKLVSPVVDMGEGRLDSVKFKDSCRLIAQALDVNDGRWRLAYERARSEQLDFEARCVELGRQALRFAQKHGIMSVVVLGRPYTIYNKVLNSNVPAILREQGALAIPVDCYPISADTPLIDGVYWGYSQRNLRAAWQARRTPGVYTLWCSNYSCGPDSFNLHFYGDLMRGKPYAVIETDGHAGDAGTKTRVEAFLHCVAEDFAANERAAAAPFIRPDRIGLEDIRERRERVLIPPMGRPVTALAAVLRGAGVAAEVLPMPDRKTIRIGRRHTSGKECLPMCITLGSLLQRLEREEDGDARFASFMPRTDGPCRFGCYSILQKAVLERLGWTDRVRLWSPDDMNYGEGLSPGFKALMLTGTAAIDMLLEGLYDTRPRESEPGAAKSIYEHYERALLRHIEAVDQTRLTPAAIVWEASSGRLFGCADILKAAARDYAQVQTAHEMPTVMVVGEIYVRADPFANDFIVDKLERRGLRVRFAPVTEWLEYADFFSRTEDGAKGLGDRLSRWIHLRIQNQAYRAMARALGWPGRTRVMDTIEAAAPYIRKELIGEAVLSVGGPVHEWRHALIDGVVNVGPLECMPSKIAEAQLFCAGEQEGLPSLTISYNGDPLDPEMVDNFAFEMHRRFRTRRREAAESFLNAIPETPVDKPDGKALHEAEAQKAEATQTVEA